MVNTRESTTEKARRDLAGRLGIDADEIEVVEVADREFSDMSLGAAPAGEMAAQMISYGWQIELAAGGKNYEYRADKYQLRLHNFEGVNYVIE